MTEKQTHTPGPFSVERTVVFSQAGIAPEHRGVEIHANGAPIGVWFDGEWDGHGPNSDLFAAAPDLLKACKEILSDAESFDTSDRNKAHIGEYHAEQLRQAIAKAEGGAE